MERQKKNGRIVQVRPAFTLVELLVVITIIGMLMALLMPAVSRAREEARRIQCTSNQGEIGKAMLAFEAAHPATGFPGWRNTVSGNSSPVSWAGMLLPYLDRSDLWQSIKTGTIPAVSLKVFICPSDPPASTATGIGPSSYVANGLVLRDPVQSLPPLNLEYISGNDGTSTTLMLSENTQVPPPAAATAGAASKGHCWYDLALPLLGGQNTSSTPAQLPQLAQTFGFNVTSSAYSSALQTFAGAYGNQVSDYNGNPMTANINSSHGGGAVVIFFDGHGQFLRDDAGLNLNTGSTTVTVYQVLVTPDGSKIGGEPPADDSIY
jgi:prepilin-type N-terminal cleavage/methylation domain-containing protein/prepilin-type processing-associated H-X9-DG protein